jgi:UDP-4-amino-4,6-dideoxy-N-acetyl-beta-L-altrosamine transaminase
MKVIPYGRQSITQQDIDAVVETLRSDFLTQGPKVKEFEEKFAKYIGANHAVAVSNGTAALHLSALALGVNSTSDVITTPMTFSASANCVRYCGGKVSFADIDPSTALLDLEKVRTLLRQSPRGTFQGIIPVDFAGYPVDLEKFRALADEYGLWIIEDACHAPGAWFTDSKGRKQHCGNGTYADLAIFSFHPVKHIATGEGGMITTNNSELYSKLLRLRTHGITKDASLLTQNDGGWYYEMQELGFNYRMPDVLCALGISQLSRADEGFAVRQAIARRYDKAFGSNRVIRPLVQSRELEKQGMCHAYHLYIVLTQERLRLYNYLKDQGIHAQVHYVPVHRMPYYQKQGPAGVSYPKAESYYEECLSLPMYPTLSEPDQKFVIECVNNFTKTS